MFAVCTILVAAVHLSLANMRGKEEGRKETGRQLARRRREELVREGGSGTNERVHTRGSE